MTISREMRSHVSSHFERMPARPILNFLVQFFLEEVNWISQLIHPPSFMTRYESWWANQQHASVSSLSVADIDFAVLILRICAFATQFLPSASYMVDSVRGVPLAAIRETSTQAGDNLEKGATGINPRGSLFRVQHMCFYALNAACESHMKESWSTLCSAIRVAQGPGYHQEAKGADAMLVDEVEGEMRRRVFCNLYIVDGHLARQLDWVPFLTGELDVDCLPRMHLTPGVDPDSGAPDSFTERLLEARLVTFWRVMKPGHWANSEYDPNLAQQRHEKFHEDFINTLPPSFALEPSREWDNRLPHLPLQRQLLHVAIFESVCHNFRPLLLFERARLHSLPAYKQVLILSQARGLALAALKVLDAVSTLHDMIGATHTRFATIIFHTFEASVLLLCLCIKGFLSESAAQDIAGLQTFPPDSSGGSHFGMGSLGQASSVDKEAHINRDRCIREAQSALARLQVLANVSVMAEVSAQSLSQLLQRATAAPGPVRTTTPTPTSVGDQDNQLSIPGISWQEDVSDTPDTREESFTIRYARNFSADDQ
ncbi:hypothetical protein DL771_005689 [Monosporascus sp. 5C6A]|nr:hypothetical protein DL771_005689 [Monosporascus sp. 5C6A]